MAPYLALRLGVLGVNSQSQGSGLLGPILPEQETCVWKKNKLQGLWARQGGPPHQQ